MESVKLMDVEEGFVYGGWLVIRKALFGTEKGFDTSWHSLDIILCVVLLDNFKTQERITLKERKCQINS